MEKKKKKSFRRLLTKEPALKHFHSIRLLSRERQSAKQKAGAPIKIVKMKTAQKIKERREHQGAVEEKKKRWDNQMKVRTIDTSSKHQ